MVPQQYYRTLKATGRYTVVFNGEIYKHLPLRDELRSRGYGFRTESDTETLLASFVRWFDAGSSVFSTSGWANPTLTIVALSLRLADHLDTRLA
ncbi:MAG: hypothetical protein WBS20_14305 [Lysobacterales bacterium]